jgi:hemolysin activation/secretion protein
VIFAGEISPGSSPSFMYFRNLFLVGFLGLLSIQSLLAQAASGTTPVYPLKKLLIADTAEKAAALPAESGGASTVFTTGVTVLDAPDFPAVITPFLGRPISLETANALAEAIKDYVKKHDRLIVNFRAPEPQDFSGGVLRLAVVMGTYRDVEVRGNKWFSSKMLIDKLGVRPGDEIRVSVLDDAINWANANPFRQIKVLIDPLKDQPDQANLIIGVQERLPLRLTLSVDNAGSDLLGNTRFTGAVQFGNLWGKDHQGSYQYSTSNKIDVLQSHAVDYRWPLPWRHYVQFTGGYSKVTPSFGGSSGKDFKLDGENLNSAIRYIYPVRTGDNPIEFSAGIDFKQGNNTLLYNNTLLPNNSGENQVIQFTFGYSFVKRDWLGAWLIGLNMNVSPGNLTDRNTKRAFQSRFQTEVRYLIGSLSVQRLVNLPHEWSVFSRFALQLASANVPGSEQLSVGGSTTVRGYNERIETGDEGMVLSTDLQSPPLRTTLPFLKKRPPLETRFTVFYDFGTVSYKFPDKNDLHLKPLASTGVGLRLSLPVNFSLNADYGWQLNERARQSTGSRIDPEDYHDRGHIKVVLAF